jgi:hypothetical protein
MPSSNFLRSRWLLYIVVAITLGLVSPTIARLLDFSDPAARQGLLYWWFVGGPAFVDALLAPAAASQELLWAAVFTLQYLCVFVFSATLVLLIQRWTAPAPPAKSPPARDRAFDTAAAMYHLRDSW